MSQWGTGASNTTAASAGPIDPSWGEAGAVVVFAARATAFASIDTREGQGWTG